MTVARVAYQNRCQVTWGIFLMAGALENEPPNRQRPPQPQQQSTSGGFPKPITTPGVKGDDASTVVDRSTVHLMIMEAEHCSLFQQTSASPASTLCMAVLVGRLAAPMRFSHVAVMHLLDSLLPVAHSHGAPSPCSLHLPLMYCCRR